MTNRDLSRSDEPTLADLGEFGVIDRVVGAAETSEPVVIGPGDDAAVLSVPTGAIACSTDALVEGVHFRRDWSTGTEIGRKAVAVNVADVEAMGATPIGITLALSAPADLPLAWLDEFAGGVRAECATAGVQLVGGDTTAGPVISIAVTALGDLAGRQPVTRGGARPGQVVAMIGRLGWAAAGLRTLSRGFRSPRAVVDLQRCPQVPYGSGRVAADAGASSMIDISDGLLADLGHVAMASGVSFDIDTSTLEIAEPLQAVAAATGGDPLAFVLTGGEDHALVATFDTAPAGWTVIGRVIEAAGEGPAVTVDGAPYEGTAGFDHFGAAR
ncbi:MAG: thiamine-phosphate kinase [Propionibacteriales bacterium]|nr:thiamine-phosphate kinase [Propionibacteriales bacterium]